ncbi:MAG TPA: SusC/RagA family protein [Bacteroidales bacterium]|nr:SusC/RagA family protein [Bacteroidales bacterium]
MGQIYSKLKVVIILLFFAGISTISFAQLVNVTGTVVDATDGSPLAGVTVIQKGTSNGTSTNMDGFYSLSVEFGQTLVFSFVGYAPQEFVVGNPSLNVQLVEQSELLSEFVVIGYGVQKKTDATGSVTAIGTEDFNKGLITSPQALMSGKISGVQVSSDGTPGGGAAIRIRGGSSMSASNDPLIVVDGIPLDNDGISGSGNSLNAVNPNDIETFTVLKDASATAIFGSRASNGVIMITTKKGKKGDALKLSYTGKGSFYTVPNQIDVLSSSEFRSLVNERYATNANAYNLLGESVTDWQSEILEPAFGQDHYLVASGAYKNLPYRVSVGYTNQDGILKTSNFERKTGAVALNPSFLKDHLKVNINAKVMNEGNRWANNGALSSAMLFDPTQSVLSGNPAAYNGYTTWLQTNGSGLPITIATSNPVAMLDLREDISNADRFIGNAQLDYKFHFLPDLHFNINVAGDFSTSNGTIWIPATAAMNYILDSYGRLDGGVRRSYQQDKKNELLDAYFNYAKDITAVDGRIDLLAGYSWQHFWRKGSAFETNARGIRIVEDTDYETESYLVSFFGRLNYTMKNKYLATFTLRQDGSSRFSPDTRWGLFPSAAVAWKISEEGFLKESKLISDLKLRIGYGVTGQQNIGNDYPYLARYTYSESTAAYQFGDNFVNTLRPEGYDANLKWEETTTYNIGLDYGLFNDRIVGSIEYYFRETKDLINFIPVPAGTNLTNQILTNVGNLENKGIELSILTRPIVKDNFHWEIGANVAFNKNTITKLTAIDDPAYIGVPTGGIAGGVGNNIQIHSVGYSSYSFFVYEQVYNTEGKPIEGLYVDRNGDGQITGDDRYRLESPAPKALIGFNSSLQYKNWDFSFAGRANYGNYVYNNVDSQNGVLGGIYNSVGYLTNVTRDALFTEFENPQYFSDYYVQDASFLRMDHITLGYQVNDIINKSVDLHLSLTLQNAFVITNYTGLDPEVFGGVDYNIYPRPRTIIFGVKLDF